MDFSKALDKMGDTALTREDEEDDIGAAFQKFAVVTKELSALMKNMVRVLLSFNKYSFYPLILNYIEKVVKLSNFQHLTLKLF